MMTCHHLTPIRNKVTTDEADHWIHNITQWFDKYPNMLTKFIAIWRGNISILHSHLHRVSGSQTDETTYWLHI
jgi:3',5'-cyclic AMP phosphodiesterase CpdA